MDVESEDRDIRTELSLEAARRSVAARTEVVRITANQVEAKTANDSKRNDAQTQLAAAKAQLFDVQTQQGDRSSPTSIDVGTAMAILSFPKLAIQYPQRAFSSLGSRLVANSKVAQTTIFFRSKSFVTGSTLPSSPRQIRTKSLRSMRN